MLSTTSCCVQPVNCCTTKVTRQLQLQCNIGRLWPTGSVSFAANGFDFAMPWWCVNLTSWLFHSGLPFFTLSLVIVNLPPRLPSPSTPCTILYDLISPTFRVERFSTGGIAVLHCVQSCSPTRFSQTLQCRCHTCWCYSHAFLVLTEKNSQTQKNPDEDYSPRGAFVGVVAQVESMYTKSIGPVVILVTLAVLEPTITRIQTRAKKRG